MRITLSRKVRQQVSEFIEVCRRLGDVAGAIRLGCLMSLDKLSISEAAAVFNVSNSAITRWVYKASRKGARALVSKARPGRTPRLNAEQLSGLRTIVLAGPKKAGLSFSCWTLSIVQDLILKRFGVSLSITQVSRILHKVGVVHKKGSFRLTPSSPEARDQWLKKSFPELIARANKEKAAILFGDEVGFAPGRAPGYTWGLRGEMILVRHPGKNLQIKAFGVVDIVNGSFCYHISAKTNQHSCRDFLRILKRKYQEQKVYLILDNVSYHKTIAKELAENPSSAIEIVFLPSYSPDFNPIEQLWKVMKGRYFKNFYATTDTN